MRVKLKNQLFVEGHRLFEKGEHPEFPDELKKHLPSSATLLDKISEPAAPADADYRDLDLARANGDQLDRIEDDATERLRANQLRIRAKLAAETGKK